MRSTLLNLVIILVIILLGILFQRNYINEPPSYRHTWALADHYSLALRFTENGMNFFEPETYVLNHQFPHEMRIPAKESITAVDFPLHSFIPAGLMKLLNTNDPWVFRGYIILYSFVGLFFLFRLSFLISGDFYKSMLIVIFAATSPVFAYYQGSFLPTVPSWANAVIGMCFYTLYRKRKKPFDFWWTILFLTLAALSRTTFVIPLLAVLGWELVLILKNKSLWKYKLIPVTLSALIIAGYFLYNSYLTSNYGSIFLNHLMPAKNPDQFSKVWNAISERWLVEYFSVYHYIAFGLILILYFYSKFKEKEKEKTTPGITGPLLLMFVGCILFAVAMWMQFEHHEYYFLDTFFLPILLLLILLLNYITISRSVGLKFLLVAVISVPLIWNAEKSQGEKNVIQDWNRASRSVVNYKNSEEFLNEAGVSKTDRILVVGTQAPNVPFFLMKRKGYAIIYPSRDWVEQAMAWDFDYVMSEKEFFQQDILAHFPEFLTKFNQVIENEKLVLFRKSEKEKN